MRIGNRVVVVARGCARMLSFVALASLAACGGGGGGGTTANNVAPPTPTTLAITGFTPPSGVAGSTVTVSGAGFSSVQAARLGALTATFTVTSDTQLQLVVPTGAQTSRIELAGAGRTVLSATDFTVSNVPLVAALSPSSVLPGGRVTLGGANLDRVSQVRVNAVVFPMVTQTATAIAVDVPAGATSGTLTLVDTDGTARPQSQQLTVVAPMTLTSFTPASVITGQTLTINGSNLDRATGVAFAGGATAAIATRSATRITVTVPDAAQTGAIQVSGNAADQVVSAAPLTVVPAIRVDAGAVYRATAAGDPVTVPGSGLTEVSGVTVRGVAATVTSRTATQLVFTVPSGIACGAISLQSSSQPAVAGGTVVVGAGCAASLAGVEFAQVLSQATTETRQRLVPGKETWVRAYVVSDQSGITSPTVRLTGYRGVTILGTLAMAGPATLPSTGGAATDAVRYSETQSFNAELPLAWVASGLSVRIEVDPEQRLGPSTTQDVTPSVGSPTRLDIVLVPLVSGAFAPTLPSAAAVLDELTRRFPIPRDRITVSSRGAYTLTSVTDGLDTSTDWSNALGELRQLRDNENPGNPYRYYFGFVRRAGGSVAGIGYVPGRTAVGFDGGGWQRTMSHELGHNFGRPHAPCGSVSGPDASYPYAGGVLGPQPLVDSLPAALDIVSPVNQTDIMGYCSGSWFSDYNYRLMQSHLESLPQADVALMQTEQDRSDLLLIAGTVGDEGVSFRPVQATRGTPRFSTGEYTLRLVTQDGRTIDHAFDADLVDHAPQPERHFTTTVLNPGLLERLEVWRGDARVPTAGSLARAQREQPTGGEPMTVDWSESGGRLSVRWNPAAASHASVTHVLGGDRTVLALHRQGGTLVVDTAGLPAGGTFEISLSDGLNARLVTVAR